MAILNGCRERISSLNSAGNERGARTSRRSEEVPLCVNSEETKNHYINEEEEWWLTFPRGRRREAGGYSDRGAHAKASDYIRLAVPMRI